MANINFYKKHLNVSTVDEICKALSDTLIQTNYTYDFFVNWTKVTKNRDAFKYEVALLKSLKNSSKSHFRSQRFVNEVSRSYQSNSDSTCLSGWPYQGTEFN